MKRMNQIIRTAVVAVIGVVALVYALPAAAQSQTNGMPGEWLSRYAGARAVGFGGAYVATADAPFGALWNPAGLHQVSQNELHFETSRYFEDTSINGVGFVVPARRFPTLGITMLSLNSGSFERTDELNASLGEFSETDLAFVLTASKRVNNRLSLGTNVKIVRQQVEEFSATGVGADLGVRYILTSQLSVGASVLNIAGPTMTLRAANESFPVELRGGVAYRFLGGRGMLSTEVDHRNGPGATFRVGSEVWLHESMAIRLGHDYESATGGFSYRANQAMRFDYGVSNHELGLVHRVGMSYQFGGFFADSHASPRVFSPMGERSVTKFHIKARTKDETKDWSLEIRDKHGETVRRFGGLGVPPAHVMWDGKDGAGMTLPDGVYHYRLTVRDNANRVVRAEEKSVEITTAGPQGSVPVIIE